MPPSKKSPISHDTQSLDPIYLEVAESATGVPLTTAVFESRTNSTVLSGAPSAPGIMYLRAFLSPAV